MPEFVQCIGRRRILVEPWGDEVATGQPVSILVHIFLKEQRLASLRLLPADVDKLIAQLQIASASLKERPAETDSNEGGSARHGIKDRILAKLKL